MNNGRAGAFQALSSLGINKEAILHGLVKKEPQVQQLETVSSREQRDYETVGSKSHL
jgi:hypothetical protein